LFFPRNLLAAPGRVANCILRVARKKLPNEVEHHHRRQSAARNADEALVAGDLLTRLDPVEPTVIVEDAPKLLGVDRADACRTGAGELTPALLCPVKRQGDDVCGKGGCHVALQAA
jgi:hypothetical protein